MENDRHWLLDVAFRDDDILTCHETAARNLAKIRRMALDNLRPDPNKAFIHIKMQMAAGTTTSFDASSAMRERAYSDEVETGSLQSMQQIKDFENVAMATRS